MTTTAGGKIACRRCQFVKKDHTQCKKPAMPPSDHCRTHGGANARRIGPASHSWKGGTSLGQGGKRSRWADVLGEHNRESYLRAIRDPEILSLEGEIGLIDVRLEALVKRVAVAPGAWTDLKVLYEQLVAAMNAADSTQIRANLLAIGDLANGAVDDDRNWHQVVALTERRRSLVESERRRLVEQNMFMSREQVHAYGTALLGIVTRHVTDRDILVAIVSDFRAVIEASTKKLPATIDMG